jgi:hypothetical protein
VPIRILREKTLMLARWRILVEEVMQLGRSRGKPREKPKQRKRAGQEPANPHFFARPF